MFGFNGLQSALLGLFLLLSGCGRQQVERPNVLLISVDTLRADHLGTYGYERSVSPNLDALAAESVVFENAMASASWTLPSFASVMTGQFPETHRCWNVKSRLDSSLPTMAEIMSVSGYETTCYVSHFALSRKFGLQQGFVHFDDQADFAVEGSNQTITSPQVDQRAVKWFEQRASVEDGAPWFLWLHYFDPHADYQSHAGAPDELNGTDEVSRYDNEIHFTDQSIGRVLQSLDDLGLDENTIIIFHSDHGEEFGDHGGAHHGRTLHREVLRVPLFIRAPGIRPARVTELVRTVDILPTVMDLVDLAVPVDIAGQSLRPALEGRPDPNLPALAQIRLYSSDFYDGIMRGKWKLLVDIAGDNHQLYDIQADPLEQVNLYQLEPQMVEQLRDEMQSMIATSIERGSHYSQDTAMGLTSGELNHMRNLGYLGDDE